MQRVTPAVRVAVVAGGLLIAWLAAGCGPAGARQQATVQGCADYGAQLIRQHRTATTEPAACRGLNQAQVERAVGQAVRLAIGSRHKAVARRLAVVAGARLAYLITVARPAALAGRGPAGPARPRPPAARPGTGRDTAAAIAALVSWLLTAGTGGYLLARWISHGGARRPRSRSAGLPPAVLYGHFGLAVTGLLIWAAFVVTAVAALAWTAAGLLLPVAGLGFATLALLISGDQQAAPVQARPQAPRGGRVPVLLIAGHGAAAALTILLVVLAALAT